MNLSSNEIQTNASDEIIFKTLSNCNNFKQYAPEVSNWTSTEDSCNFSIQGIGDVEMHISEKDPFSLIVFHIKNHQIKSFVISFTIKNNHQSSFLIGHSKVEVPFFLAQMIKPPLQKFLNTLVERIKDVVENNAITTSS